MLDSAKFATFFGIEQGTAGHDYLLLDGKIKLFCANDKVVLISANARAYATIKESIWDIVSAEPGAHLMLTRSGDIALQLNFSSDETDETDRAALLVQALVPNLVELK